MATTKTTNSYTGNNTNNALAFNFPYFKTEDVKVSLNGTTLDTTKYQFPTATSIQFNNVGTGTETQLSDGSPKTGVTILIYRNTDIGTAKAVFASGSAFRARDLNDNNDQLLFFAQEIDDIANPQGTGFTAPSFTASDLNAAFSDKVDGSLLYFDGTASTFKADATTTKLTIVHGGSF
tara:strand:- start:7069 stop:7602 length:534 start_codon:yes stop_codon:yes gene_type:complete